MLTLPPSYVRARDEARDRLAAGDAEAAFHRFRPVLEYPGQLAGAGEHHFRDGLSCFRDIVTAVGDEELATLAKRAAQDSNDADSLVDLACELYEQRLHGIAATVLTRAREVAPKQVRVVSELVCNLEQIMRNDEACRVLEECSELVKRDGFLRYLWAFNSLMNGDLQHPRQLLPQLRREDDPDLAVVTAAVEGMLARADALADTARLDETDLRGWHLVVNGGVLLHHSPSGLGADSYGLLRHGIDQVVRTLDLAAIAVTRVVALPDRSSRILARAVAQVLGLPCVRWRDGFDQSGLLVAYDLQGVEESRCLTQLGTHRPGQRLWAHAASWTDPFVYASDFVTFFYEYNVAPWEGGPDAPEAELAERIAAAGPEPDLRSELEELRRLIGAVRRVPGAETAELFRDAGSRRHQRVGLPFESGPR